VRGLIPFTHARSKLGLEVRFRVNIRDAQAWAWAHAAPVLHLVQPGAVDRRTVHHHSWRLASPLPDFCAVMGADMIAHAMKRRERGDKRRVPLFPKGEACLLTLARVTWPPDDSRTGVECGQSIQGPPALLCMRIAVGKIPRVSGPPRRETRPRGSGGVLIT
jgi:hypothetical protein